MNRAPTTTADSGRHSLYRIGGAAALICALMYLIALVVYLPAQRSGPPPDTPLAWFTLFQTDPLTGLFFLGLADVVIAILWGPLSLALYTTLRRYDRAWSTIATTLVFVGMGVYLATNTAFSVLSLSRHYAAATTEAERSILLAAGQAMIAVSEGTGGQYAGLPLQWLGGLILSAVMLRGRDFSKATAWVGIVGLGLLVASMPFAGYTTGTPETAAVVAIVAVTYAGGGLLSLAWYILVGLKLLRLGQADEEAVAQQA